MFYLFKILHIEGAKAKAISNPRFNIGNVPFELNIRSITEITVVGTQEIEAVETVEPPIVSWDDVAYQEGQKICKSIVLYYYYYVFYTYNTIYIYIQYIQFFNYNIQLYNLQFTINNNWLFLFVLAVEGWIKFNFRESKHFNNESTQGFGSITDGNKKLEVRLTSMIGLPADLEKGMSVKVTGMVCFGTYLYVKVESGADVIATGHDALDVTTMINITSPPIKKPKLA